MKSVPFVLAILFSTFFLGEIKAQDLEKDAYEILAIKADSFWYEKSYIPLLPVLDKMLKIAEENRDVKKQVEVLIQLHEYEGFYTSNNQKALKHLVNAIDLADRYDLGELRLKTRSKMMFFHQSTAQDEALVSDLLSQMKEINKSVQSEFYDIVIAQWTAQIIGTKRFLKMPVSEEEVRKGVTIVKETIKYFDPNIEDHLFYYQQVRRNIIGYYGDYFGYKQCKQYNNEINDVAHLMKDPITEIGNLMFESAFLRRFGKYKELLERFKEKEYLLESASHGMSKFYHQAMAESYVEVGDFRNALNSTERMYFYDQEVNKTAFANRVEAIRLERVSQELQGQNDTLSTYNLYFLLFAVLVLIAFLGAMFSWNKIRGQAHLIEEQRIGLEEMNRAKNKLFSILAHDLKEPISSFANLSNKVNYLVGKEDWQSLDKMTIQLQEKTTNLASILDNILPWMSSQIKDSKKNLALVHLKPILNDSLMELSIQLEQKSISTTINITSNEEVYVDRDALQIVLRNVLANAIKYSERESRIEIWSEPLKKETRIYIRDFGKGISPTNLNRIFTEYQSTVGTSGEVGHGLGLKLSKDLLLSMNGNISIESKLGTGTTVMLTVQNQ